MPGNREIDQTSLTKIINSIKVKNLLYLRPIMVNSKYQVVDGQHRLEAAKALDLEVFYQVNPECSHEDIVLLNYNQKSWSNLDWVHYYATTGNENYQKIYDFCNKYKVEMIDFIYCYIRNSTWGNARYIKLGKFKYTDINEEEMAERIATVNKCAEIIKRMSLEKRKPGGPKFKGFLYAFLSNPDVDQELFIAKLTQRIDVVRCCSDGYSYTQMFKKIYNYRNQNPVD